MAQKEGKVIPFKRKKESDEKRAFDGFEYGFNEGNAGG